MIDSPLYFVCGFLRQSHFTMLGIKAAAFSRSFPFLRIGYVLHRSLHGIQLAKFNEKAHEYDWTVILRKEAVDEQAGVQV